MKHTLFFLFLFTLTLTVSSQTIYYVSKNGNDNNDGKSWATAKKEVQTAIDAAQENDQVWIAEGTYHPTKYIKIGDPRYKSFIMKKGISIYGSFNGTEKSINDRKPITETTSKTILSGDTDGIEDVWTFDNDKREWIVTGNNNNSLHVIYSPAIMQLNQTIDGFEISGGNARKIYATEEDSYGGGIYAKAYLHVFNCVITRNIASSGGGIYLNSDLQTTNKIEECHIFQNKSDEQGGGVYIISYGSITNSIIESNFSKEGGGAYVSYSSEINNSTILNNIASSGGGLYLRGFAKNCIIKDNFAIENGGGIYTEDSHSTSTCEIFNNWSEKDGGGIYGNSLAKEIVNCRIYNNTAKGNGGGARILGDKIIGSKVYNNTAYGNGGGVTITHGYGTVSNCNIFSNLSMKNGGGVSFDYEGKYYTRTPSLNNNIAKNTAKESGGGIYISEIAPYYMITIDSDSIHNNIAGLNGGGGNINNSNVSFSKCKIFSNSTLTNGGGINSNYKIDIINSLISNNKASIGGGVSASSGTITNSIISNNTADKYAVFNNTSPDISLSILSSTIANNSSQNGELLSNDNNIIKNTIIWNNNGKFIINSPSNIQYSAIQQQEYINETCILLDTENINDLNNKKYPAFSKPTTFVGNTSTDSQIEELNNAKWRITESSACRNTGNPTGNYSSFDFYGYRRVEENRIDIGAAEYQNAGIKLPIKEDFENCTNGTITDSKFFNATEGWNVEKYMGEGSLAASFNYKSGQTTHKAYITSVKLNVENVKEVKVSYDLSLTPIQPHQHSSNLDIEVSSDSVYWHTIGYNSEWGEEIPLQNFSHTYNNQKEYLYVRFYCYGDNAQDIYWYLDNIKIEEVGGSSIEAGIENKSLIKVYPNPTKDVIKIDCEETLNVQIYSISGTKVMESSDKEISIEHLTSGIYTVIIKTPDRRQVTKIIKSN